MKNKKLLLILPAILLIAWCTPKTWPQVIQNDDQWNTTIWSTYEENTPTKNNSINYENKQYNFSLEIPEWWVLKENEKNFDTLLYTPQNDDIRENVGITVQTPQVQYTVNDYYENSIDWLWTIIESKDIEVKWIKWKSTIYETTAWELKIKWQQAFLISDDNIVYNIQYTATDKTFDKYIKEVNSIINSFTILN